MGRIAARATAGLAVAGAAALLAGCGDGGATAAASRHPGATARPTYLQVFARRHALSLLVVAGLTTHGFDLDGTEHGLMLVRVPVGWRVRVTFANRSTLANSLAVVAGAESAPAFAGAGAPVGHLRRGIGPGERATFTFVASRPGVYRLASLVPGHETSGMWATFEVVAHGRPSLRLGVTP
jgi:FtsP/CotA-like multicopper oxidase with cupredoxin domain